MDTIDYTKYLYSAPTPPRRPKHRRNRSYKRHSRRPRVIAVTIIIACFFVTAFLAEYYTSGYVATFGTNKVDYYAILYGRYTSYETATTYAETVRDRGGAGYITEMGEDYGVITYIYTDESDAKAVLTRLLDSGANAELYPVTLPAPRVTRDDKALLERITRGRHETYLTLTDLAAALDMETVDVYGARTTLKTAVTNIERLVEMASALSSDTLRVTTLASLTHLGHLLTTLASIADPSASDVRYSAVAVAMS